jgi:hypothetical protein
MYTDHRLPVENSTERGWELWLVPFGTLDYSKVIGVRYREMQSREVSMVPA